MVAGWRDSRDVQRTPTMQITRRDLLAALPASLATAPVAWA